MAEQPDTRLWSVVVFLGVGIGLALGAIMVMLFRDRRGGGYAMPGYQPMQQPQLGMPPIQSIALEEPMLPASVPHASAARSVTVGPTQVRILRALGIRPWKVQVRTVNPPGAIASFSTSNNPGEALMIAAGDFHEMWLSPGEDLLASANKGGVTVSVSGGEA